MEHPKFIQEIRIEIDEIDSQLLQLLGRRMKISQNIGRYKKENRLPVVQQQRWQQILNEAVKKGKNEGLSENFVKAIFNSVHDESVRIQHQQLVD